MSLAPVFGFRSVSGGQAPVRLQAHKQLRFTGRPQDPAPDMPKAWTRPDIRQRIETMMRNGKFRHKPEMAEKFLGRLQALCEKFVPNVELFKDLKTFLKQAKTSDGEIPFTLAVTEKERINRRVAQVQKLLEPDITPNNFLDIGCGSGNITADLAKAFRLPRDKALGTDLFYPKFANTAFRFIPLDGKHIPLRSNSIDLASLFAVLHHADNPKALLQEAHRVLKENGRLIVREFDAADQDIYDFNLLMDHLLYEVFDETPDMPIPGHYFSAEKWIGLFEEAGFHVEKIERPEPTNPFNPFLSVLRKKRATPED